MKIKYRCYDKSRKTFVSWDDLAISPSTPQEKYEDGRIWESGEDGKLSDELETNENLVFQLYTGLIDKNEEEIYEGDFLNGEPYEFPVEVVFKKGGFGVKYTNRILYFSELNLSSNKVGCWTVGKNTFETESEVNDRKCKMAMLELE